ncbi:MULTISPECIES: hypothetical protein [Methylobacterium]|uniref:Uncharacterized protein n=1 Tax=Methylobacterium jeotgali TaxID=381630 RepID=A0ABQ4SZH0_9HYPH|nr:MULTISPECIES: hypothetical protein [Methylobacterium]PIU06890.1 MAG: hypothetical protein COT56_07085 [Methylobacterium sp. CG09_land_8_20_14_0_10_71_15]PIU16102.1 MAG: hypothetical protein COT28_01405 [Methylobacterium sp. CG08_land_8_20_14_0_20_71_15]GBU19365.1 hypothetical protein AwMethylo_35800 [Methylobacterium sp.]GJE08606.1 hypothetical protein AOPFMNJM_3949 [Methylobacterium jeotgali]
MLDTHQRGGPDDGPEVTMPDSAGDPTSLVALQIAQAVTNQKVEEVGRMVTELRGELRELKSSFATKAELKALEEEVQGLRNWNKWVVQIIGGVILTAILGTIIIKGGIPHP